MRTLFRTQEEPLDVVATPVGQHETAWWLTSRLGRPLGAIRTVPGSNEVAIVSGTWSRLSGMPTHHPSLDDALTAIEECLGGVCELNPDMKD
ncbi:hypothetical protein [Methylobacterium nigriterrae]|uniref:hypothetical protein n=1 Tax=Methylobacterium nigriterrae TaxID=3127512 RepID=UPI003013E9D4